MLILEEKQLAALELAATRSFERRMIAHLGDYFPEECQRAGEAGIREAIAQGIARAAAHGLVNEVDVARYIDVSVVLGQSPNPAEAQKWVPDLPQGVTLTPAMKLRVIFDEVMRMHALAASR